MIRIREAIIVEGRYDKNVLSQIVDASIFETGGFGVMKDKEKIAFFRAIAEKRGLIIFTDSDGAGFVIRNRLKGLLPPEKLLHAYIPQIPGKERRKNKAGKEGLLGVEGMTPEVILEALRKSGAHFIGQQDAPVPSCLTRQDLYALGLSGGEGSQAKREKVKKALGLPSHLGTKAFLDALNLITTREELEIILSD